MRVVLQRVSQASVTVEGTVSGAIQQGLVLLLGVGHDDSETALNWLAEKCVNLRIFEDEQGKMNRSLLDVGGSILLISQFTLYGRCEKGRRPDFMQAAAPQKAETMYQQFGARLQELGVEVAWGVFGAHMDLALVNDGPVTMLLER
jgi:D-tyrosyl-tRNA(Tyr) deacylase